MADGIRRIARAYYERASAEEKNEAKQFFSELDMNGDGKIKVTELASCVSGTEADPESDKFCKYLDSDGDGVLGFSDILALFYIQQGKVMNFEITCDGCGEPVFGDPYFSCVLCLPKYPKTHDLCCDCYGRGKFDHCHPLTNFMHTQNHMGDVLKHHQEKTTQPTLDSAERASEEEKNEAKRVQIKTESYDGVLGFSDLLVLFYTIQDKVNMEIGCDGCDELVFGDPYFSCVLCLPKYPQSYDLCCDCYGRGKFDHCHPLTNFIHNQDHMGHVLKDHQGKTTRATGEMEELRKIATMIYESASADVKASASYFFWRMDKDGDQRVNMTEFLSSMSQQGHQQLQTRRMFQELDGDGDGSLDFTEVVTLYYIIKSCRPTCNWCKDFIPGIFFSCVFCFKAGTSYDLCRTCYLADDANHTHHGATQFLDNFAFLQNIREYLIEARHQQGNGLSQSQAIVPASGQHAQSNMKVGKVIVETICQITSAVCGIVSAASSCTIM